MIKLLKPPPKGRPKELARFRRWRADLERTYYVLARHTLVGWFVERGTLTAQQAADPDKVAAVLAAALDEHPRLKEFWDANHRK